MPFLLIIVINIFEIINFKDNIMSYDIYNNINESEIIKVIMQGKLRFNQFMQEAILEYKLGFKCSSD